eukprot:15463329-Alexandrium_andersonii.AAC.1
MSVGRCRKARETASGRPPEAVSGVFRRLPALLGTFQRFYVAEKRLKLPEAGPSGFWWSAVGG